MSEGNRLCASTTGHNGDRTNARDDRLEREYVAGVWVINARDCAQVTLFFSFCGSCPTAVVS